MNPLANAMSCFAHAYNGSLALTAEQRGWSCTVAFVATDSGAAVAARIEDGRLVSIFEEASGDVVVTSDEATLRDILELRRGPDEPYLFGELTVRGSESDFLRLGYIAGALCPERAPAVTHGD